MLPGNIHEHKGETTKMRKYITNFTCPKCGRKLFTSDLEEYAFVCTDCDENFYRMEVRQHIGDMYEVRVPCPADRYRKCWKQLALTSTIAGCDFMVFDDSKEAVVFQWKDPANEQIRTVQARLEDLDFPDWETQDSSEQERNLYIKHPELEDISLICYYRNNGDNYPHIVNMESPEKVENTGESWAEAAYGNLLIYLNIQKITDALYLFKRESANSFYLSADREDMEQHLKKQADAIITREGVQFRS